MSHKRRQIPKIPLRWAVRHGKKTLEAKMEVKHFDETGYTHSTFEWMEVPEKVIY